MFSVLLIGTNTAYIKQQALEICKKEGIDPFDITTIATASSLGIEDVREVQKLLFLQPLRGTKKAIIIEKSHMATIEAQNALLKTLEEPPLSTVIILLAETEHTLLPTILSRCTIFTYKEEEKLADTSIEELQKELANIHTLAIGEKLQIAQDIAKDKEKTLVWLRDMLYAAHNGLHQGDEKLTLYHHAAIHLQEAYQLAKGTNVNLRFLMENTLITI